MGSISKGKIPISRIPLARCMEKCRSIPSSSELQSWFFLKYWFKDFYQQPGSWYTILTDKVSADITKIGYYYRVSWISWSNDCDSVWLHLIQPNARWYIWEPGGQITAVRWKILSWKNVTLSETEKASGDKSFNMSSQCKAAAQRAGVSS